MTLPQPKPPATFRKQVLSLLGETYGDKTLVLCPTVFVRLLKGDHKAAILLSQILYWSDRTKDPDGWFYKSYADWQRETGLSEAQVRRIVNGDARARSSQVTLRDLGVETLLRKVRHTGAPTLHYRVNQVQFLSVLQAFLGQGDPQQCAGSIPSKVQDQPLEISGMKAEESAASLILPETTASETATADQPSSNPTHHPDEDSDLALFQAYEGRFGQLKSLSETHLQAELARLGAAKVREVLERCATRGRSWQYVLRALANEAALVAVPAGLSYGGFPAFENDNQAQYPQAASESSLPVSERLQTPWPNRLKPDSTVADAWSAAFHQLATQLDSVSFQTNLRDALLIDFLPETSTFVVAVRSLYARDLLQGRLYRTVRRVLVDIYGQPAEVQFVLRDEWAGQGEQIA